MIKDYLEQMQAQQEAVCNVQSLLESYIDLCRSRKVNSDYAKKVAVEEVIMVETLLEDLKTRGEWARRKSELVQKLFEDI